MSTEIAEEPQMLPEFELDNTDELSGLGDLAETQYAQHSTLSTIFSSLAKTAEAKGANKVQLGYLVKLSEQLTSNANAINSILKARNTLKKDIVTHNLNVKKASIQEEQGDQSLMLNSELIKLIQSSLSSLPAPIDGNVDDIHQESDQPEMDAIDKQIENSLSNEGEIEATEGNSVIIADTDGYLYFYDLDTEEINSIMDDDLTPTMADEIVFSSKEQEYYAVYGDEVYEVYDLT